MNNYRFYLTVCLILCFLSGCRQELPMIRSEVEYVTMPSDPQSVEQRREYGKQQVYNRSF